MKKKKILIIGPYPPPYGGVSIHIKRLKSLLAGSFDIDIIDEGRLKKENVFNMRSLNLFSYLRKIFSVDVVHIHSGLLTLRLLHFIIASLFLKKIIITIHGYESGRGIVERTLDRIMLNHCSKIIFVSKEIANRFEIKKYFIRDAFLPPDVSNEEDIPGEVSTWIETKQLNDYKICSANAWRLDRHNNEDLYGLDLCIIAAKKIKATGIKAAFVFIVCESTGIIKIDQYKQMITDFGLEDSFLLFESPISFIKLIMKSDIVIRPTNTDGDALTIREGLFLGKTVIASDVVLRPNGVKLFKSRDTDSLAQVIITVCKVGGDKQKGVPDFVNSSAAYIDYYKKNIYN